MTTQHETNSLEDMSRIKRDTQVTGQSRANNISDLTYADGKTRSKKEVLSAKNIYARKQFEQNQEPDVQLHQILNNNESEFLPKIKKKKLKKKSRNPKVKMLESHIDSTGSFGYALPP